MGAVEAEKEYILGTGDDELARLGVQHRIWADAAVGAWKRAGIGPGARVLDVGCGPGYATFDLAQLVSSEGAVVGVDESARFVEYVNAQARGRGLPRVSAVIGDVQKLQGALTGQGSFDAAYARWTLCWLGRPELAVQGVAGALKPGGRFIVQDYFDWETMTIAPKTRAVDRLIGAARESFIERHADMDLCGKLPGIFRAAGLELAHFAAHPRVVRGGGSDSTLAWPLTWWRTYGPKLVGMGKLSKAECDGALEDLADLEKNPDRFFVCPTVYEFIGVRAARRS